MNGRVKPRFEDLAYASLKPPKLKPPPTLLLPPPNDHEQAIMDFRDMSQDIKARQFKAAATRATAERIAQETGVPVEMALGAMANEHSRQETAAAAAAQANAAAAGQERLDLLNQERFFGQMQLEYRHNLQMQRVAQQVQTAANPVDAAAAQL